MLIGLHGKIGHGKTTVAAHLVGEHGFVRVRLAGVIKDVIGAQLFGMTEAQTDGFLKEAPCVDVAGLDAEALAERTVELIGPLGGPRGLEGASLRARWRAVYAPLFAAGARLYSPREIMRAVGDGARAHVARTIWLDLWREAYRTSGATRVVVDDVRYPNEKGTLEAEGGEVWRIVRTDVPSADRHPSETACDHLPDAAFAVAIRRATGVPELLEEVDRLLDARLATDVARAG